MAATRTTKKTATKRERELVDALIAAKRQLSESRQRGVEHRDQIAAMKAARVERMTTDRREFDDAGNPRPNSEAAKLAKKIAEAEDRDNFPSLIASDERRVAEAERALGKFREERCFELLVEMLPEGQKVLADWREWLSEGRPKLNAIIEMAGRATNISAQARTYDPRTIPDFEHFRRALRQLEQEPPLPLPTGFLLELAQQEGDDDE